MNRSTYPQRDQKVEEMDSLQSSQLYGPANLDKVSENVKDIRQNHKLHHGIHEKLSNGINSGGKKFIRNENTEKHLPGRCAFAITTCHSNKATQL